MHWSTRGDIVAFARGATGMKWSGPQKLRSTGPTTGYLATAHVKEGAVRIVINCSLPSCRAVVSLEAALRTGRRPLGHVALNLATTGSVTRTLALPGWTRARLTHGRHLLTHFTFSVNEGDGTSEQVQRTIRLHR